LLALCVAAFATRTRAQEPNVGELFATLIAEGEREQIPWTVTLAEPQLRLDQRLGAEAKISIDQEPLNRHGEKHDLLVMARVAPLGGDWLPGLEWLALPVEKPLASNTTLEFQFFFVARPGDFRIGIVLFDRVSGHSNATIRTLRVESLRDDPLPQAFRDLPAAEFLTATEGFEAAFLTKMKGKLWLPVESQRNLQIEILANFSPSEEFTVQQSRPPPFRFGRRRRSVPTVEDHLFVTLAALKPLAELQWRGGLRITALDLLRRRAIFDQQPLAPAEWPRLSESLDDFKSNVVSTETLLAQKESAEFLRQVLRERLQASTASSGSAVAPQKEPPLRVIIFLSGAMVFPKGADLSPIEKAPSCNCRVYFIRLRPFGNYWDQLDAILRPLKPRRFDVRTPAEYRRALAAILADLREL
jgi:hypothetical protein